VHKLASERSYDIGFLVVECALHRTRTETLRHMRCAFRYELAELIDIALLPNYSA
jgi:hypothetical protein